MNIEYVPKEPKKEEPKSSYILVNDVTGKPPAIRGPQVLKAVTTDLSGSRLDIPFKVPYPPKANCKKCFGRGYRGIQTVGGQKGILYCKKCYPML